MKLLMVSDNLFSGGKERRFVELLKGLSKHPEISCEVVIMEKRENTHFTEIFSLPFKVHFVPRKSRKDLRIIPTIWKIVRDFQPAVIHTWGSMSSVVFLPVALMQKKALIYTISDAPISVKRFGPIWWRTKLVFPFARMIIANSRAGLKSYHVNSKKGAVIFNGFEFDRLQNIVPLHEVKTRFNIRTPLVVGMVARFRSHKDYTTYFEVAGHILDQRDDVTFLAVGEGETREQYMNSVTEKYRDRIIFTGEQQLIESLIKIFDIGVLLTNFKVHGEGISNVVMEYMALGKPVIATISGGTGEIIRDLETGYLIETNDKQEIIQKILYLLDHPEARKAMGEKGEQRIASHFSIEKMVANYIDIYSRIA